MELSEKLMSHCAPFSVTSKNIILKVPVLPDKRIAKLLKKDIAFPACLGIGMLVSLVSFLIL